MNATAYIRKAEFDPKVKTYWLLSGVIICLVTIVGIPLLLLWIPLGLLLTGKYLARMECVLTPKALEVKKGMLVRVEKTIPLEKITDMGMVQGPIMRRLGLYRLTVETAGQSGPGGSLVSLIGIVDAKRFREAVLAQRDLLADRKSSGTAPEPGASSPGRDTALVEIRDCLLRIEGMLAQQGTK